MKKKDRKKMNHPDFVSCSKHGKRGYMSKSEAERAIRMYHPGDHLDTYECDLGTGLWHVGHLPPRVIRRGIPRDIATGETTP